MFSLPPSNNVTAQDMFGDFCLFIATHSLQLSVTGKQPDLPGEGCSLTLPPIPEQPIVTESPNCMPPAPYLPPEILFSSLIEPTTNTVQTDFIHTGPFIHSKTSAFSAPPGNNLRPNHLAGTHSDPFAAAVQLQNATTANIFGTQSGVLNANYQNNPQLIPTHPSFYHYDFGPPLQQQFPSLLPFSTPIPNQTTFGDVNTWPVFTNPFNPGDSARSNSISSVSVPRSPKRKTGGGAIKSHSAPLLSKHNKRNTFYQKGARNMVARKAEYLLVDAETEQKMRIIDFCNEVPEQRRAQIFFDFVQNLSVSYKVVYDMTDLKSSEFSAFRRRRLSSQGDAVPFEVSWKTARFLMLCMVFNEKVPEMEYGAFRKEYQTPRTKRTLTKRRIIYGNEDIKLVSNYCRPAVISQSYHNAVNTLVGGFNNIKIQ